MNSLSWMLYFADVVGGLKGVVIGGSVVSGLVAAAAAIGYMVNADCGDDDNLPALAKWVKRGAIACVCAGLVACLIPSTSTVYAIAASEMGETALKSETGGKAVRALNAWLDRQIGGDSK